MTAGGANCPAEVARTEPKGFLQAEKRALGMDLVEGGLLGHSLIPEESSILDCDLPGRTCILRSSASQTALGKEQLSIF